MKNLDTEEACPGEGTQWLFVMVDSYSRGDLESAQEPS